MTNKTYTDLLALVQALAGVDSFTSAEQTKVLALANRRLKQAYDACPVWPRYYIAAQARPTNSDGVIERSYDNVAGIRTGSATRSGSTVTVVCSAELDVAVGMSVVISGLTGTVNPNGTYPIVGITRTTIDNDTFTYTLDTTNTGTETYSGTANMAPVAIPDIDEFVRIWQGTPYSFGYSREYEFYVDSIGANPIGVQNATGFYVAFKKDWDGPYTTASTTIPQEFFYYAAHATYADFLRMDGQIEKAMAEENVANEYIVLELEKAENQRNVNNSFRRISTYNSRQYR
jgi:hypothetical protein